MNNDPDDSSDNYSSSSGSSIEPSMLLEIQGLTGIDPGTVFLPVEKNDEMSDKEDLDKEDHDKEDYDKEDYDKEDHDKKYHDKENLDKEDHAKEDLDKENLDKEDLDKEDLDKENLDKEDLDKEDLDKEDLDKEDDNDEDKQKQACPFVPLLPTNTTITTTTSKNKEPLVNSNIPKNTSADREDTIITNPTSKKVSSSDKAITHPCESGDPTKINIPKNTTEIRIGDSILQLQRSIDGTSPIIERPSGCIVTIRQDIKGTTPCWTAHSTCEVNAVCPELKLPPENSSPSVPTTLTNQNIKYTARTTPIPAFPFKPNAMVECMAIYDPIQKCHILQLVDMTVDNVKPTKGNYFTVPHRDPHVRGKLAEKQLNERKRRSKRKQMMTNSEKDKGSGDRVDRMTRKK